MRIELPNGCSCTDIKVHPKNWNRVTASLAKPWYIYYRFHDPLFKEQHPNGFLKITKSTINQYKTVKQRQKAAKILLDNEWSMLREWGYNPITGASTEQEEQHHDYIISPDLELVSAWDEAIKRYETVPAAMSDVQSNMKFMKKAAVQLRLDSRPIKDIKRRHVIMILDQCAKTKTTWTAATYNRYLRTLVSIFKELLKVEAIEFNPARDIDYKKKTRKKKVVLTPVERQAIDSKLRKDNYTFWRFIHIFFHSGARTTEIMQVRTEHVDLKRQMVTYTIRKGEVIREEERPIKTCVLHLWEQAMQHAKAGDYLFAKGLEPGAKAIRPDQIKRRWHTWVQREEAAGGMGIKASWYSLKHLNTDEMDAMYGTDVAALLNQHNPDMVRKHYAVNHKQRQMDIIKEAGNTFA